MARDLDVQLLEAVSVDQIDGYGELARGEVPLAPRARELVAEPKGPDRTLPTVERVITCRWNTDVVPDGALLGRASEDLGW